MLLAWLFVVMTSFFYEYLVNYYCVEMTSFYELLVNYCEQITSFYELIVNYCVQIISFYELLVNYRVRVSTKICKCILCHTYASMLYSRAVFVILCSYLVFNPKFIYRMQIIFFKLSLVL